MMGSSCFRRCAFVALAIVGVTTAFSPISINHNRRHSSVSLQAHRDENLFKKTNRIAQSAAGILAAGLLLFSAPNVPTVSAADSRVIGEIKGSGLVFKDTLVVESFDDPKVRGVTLYISNFQRPLNERLSKDFFNDPSYASVGCAKTSSKIEIADNIDKSKSGEEVFEESRSLLFKALRVQRIYDTEKNSVVYVSFNTRLDKNEDTNKSRFKSSICAVNLD